MKRPCLKKMRVHSLHIYAVSEECCSNVLCNKTSNTIINRKMAPYKYIYKVYV